MQLWLPLFNALETCQELCSSGSMAMCRSVPSFTLNVAVVALREHSRSRPVGEVCVPLPTLPLPTPLLRQPEHSTQRSHRLSEVQCVQLEASRCLSHLPARLSITRQHSRARQTHKALLKCSNCIYEAVLIYLTDCMMGLCDMVMMSKACE